ncbi:unnamed protein product, partial [marine sediment metagenome]
PDLGSGHFDSPCFVPMEARCEEGLAAIHAP